jgi:hypothetical protein
VCVRERGVCEREREVCVRERGVRERERCVCVREREVCERERCVCVRGVCVTLLAVRLAGVDGHQHLTKLTLSWYSSCQD